MGKKVDKAIKTLRDATHQLRSVNVTASDGDGMGVEISARPLAVTTVTYDGEVVTLAIIFEGSQEVNTFEGEALKSLRAEVYEYDGE